MLLAGTSKAITLFYDSPDLDVLNTTRFDCSCKGGIPATVLVQVLAEVSRLVDA